ncbi:MAG TPA: hypothetical protein O0X42_04365 [Methanocorpusculum sp.]|nr:hypothetical protein [Methanocorpusculum sp.]
MYAVIDIGSNTIRLSLYHAADGSIKLLANKKVTAGLAGYIENGRMTAEGIQRGEEALTELTQFLSYVRIKKLICFATAPLRGIDNADEVKARFENVCRSPVTILSGEDEAEIDFLGAKQNLEDKNGLIVDVGGGSTELVHYAEGKLQFTRSIPIGSLVMYRRYVKDIIPAKEETELIMNIIGKELGTTPFPENIPVICGIGGTIRGCGKLLKHHLQDKKKVSCYTPEDVRSLINLERSSLADLILKEEPERIHTIIPGSCILLAIADYIHAEKILVSNTGVREGCLMKYLAHEEVK